MVKVLGWLKQVPFLAWVILGVLAYVGYLNMTITRERRQYRILALQRDSIVAINDTTRYLHLREIDLWQRQVVQTKQQLDEVDHELHLVRTSKTNLDLRIRQLLATATAPVTADTGDAIRTAVFHRDTTPYHVHVAVQLPRAPQLASMQLGIQLDSLPMELRLSCGARNATGIRPAFASVIAPAWATVHLTQVSQDPEICAPGSVLAPKAKSHWWQWALVGVGATLLVTQVAK